MSNPFGLFAEDSEDGDTKPKAPTNVVRKQKTKKKKKPQEEVKSKTEGVSDGFTLVPKKPPRPKKEIIPEPPPPIPVKLSVDVTFASSHPLYDFHLLCLIVIYFESLKDLRTISFVCHNWYSVANSHLIWQPKVAKKKYGMPEQKQFILNSELCKQGPYWKQMYKEWYEEERKIAAKKAHKFNLESVMVTGAKDGRRRNKVWTLDLPFSDLDSD